MYAVGPTSSPQDTSTPALAGENAGENVGGTVSKKAEQESIAAGERRLRVC